MGISGHSVCGRDFELAGLEEGKKPVKLNYDDQFASERRLLAEWEDRAKDKRNVRAQKEFKAMREAFEMKWECRYITPREKTI
jgi:hypothetical protein